jgi:hypothetical protein
MSVYDFLKAYNLELQRREDLVIRLDFTSKLFSDYLFETMIAISSIAAAIYLAFNGMTILGIGQAVVIGLFIYSTIMRKEVKANRSWPPTLSPCPNGFIEYTNTANNSVECRKIGVENPSGNDIFTPVGNSKQTLCKEAMDNGLYWDQC